MPFLDDGAIDLNGLSSQVEDCVSAGVSAVALALGSELPKLTGTERRAVLGHVAEQVRGRVPLVVNVGADSVVATLARMAEARECGADVAMVMAPLFLPAGSLAVPDFFRTVIAAAPLPLILQDMAHAPLSAAVMAELAAGAPLAALKVESHPTVERVRTAVEAVPPGCPVLGGHGGSFFIEELDRGAMGTMPFASQPHSWVTIRDRHAAGDRAGARALFAARIAPVVRVAYQAHDLFYHVHKHLLVRRGILATAHVRAPTVQPDAFCADEIAAALDLADVDVSSAV